MVPHNYSNTFTGAEWIPCNSLVAFMTSHGGLDAFEADIGVSMTA